MSDIRKSDWIMDISMDIRDYFFTERVVMQWHSCPGSGGVTIPGLERSHIWDGVGLDELSGLSNLSVPVILRRH